MKISFAICTNNEGFYLKKLFDTLIEFIDNRWDQFEIVIVDDCSTENITVHELKKLINIVPKESLIIKTKKHTGDYSEQKNYLNSLCTGDWIINLDADEYMPIELLAIIPLIIDANPTVEAYWVPRLNTVDGLTKSHVVKWGWILDVMDGFRTIKSINPQSDEYKFLKEYGFIISEDSENGFVTYNEPIVCWPDPQMRIYKNIPTIKWKNKVHEQLVGYLNYTSLPYRPEYAIRHFKDIERQERQNNFYATLMK